jgi:NOL1/NOP2/sun family putative RNA methylase
MKVEDRPFVARIRKNRELYGFLEEFLGDELEALLEWVGRPLPSSIRVNTLKTTVEEVKTSLETQEFALKDVDFYADAFVVEDAPVEIGKTMEHFLGYYYVQDLASMLPPLILAPEPGETVLDLAAAPGSKTTQMAQMMENKGAIVANDLSYDRIRALASNIDRLGVLNVAVLQEDGSRIGHDMPDAFDRVLLDAPCSALGTLHSAYELPKWWGWNRIGRLVGIQRKLILSAFRALRPGGILVYSTCTLVPSENEGIVDYLLENETSARIIEIEDLKVPLRPGLTFWRKGEYDESLTLTRRVIGHEAGMEGFYIAKIGKGE